MFKKLKSILIICFIFQSTFLFSQNNALNFDGINDIVATTNTITHNSNFTYEAWVKLNDPTPDWSGIIVTKNPSLVGSGVSLLLSSTGKLKSEIIEIWPGNSNVSEGVTVVNDNTWHHVALTYDGSTIKFYVDGNLDASYPFTASLTINKELFLMAERVPTQWNVGSIDEVRIWNVTRTQSEIQNNRNNELNGNEANLLAYYNFNQGVADGNNVGLTTLNDITSNNLDGVLSNMNLNGSASNWVSGAPVLPIASSLKFDGVNDFANIPLANVSSLSNGTELTIEYWFKGSTNQSAVRLQPFSNGYYIVAGWWDGSNTKHILSFDGGTNGLPVSNSFQVADGNWHHVAMTWKANTTNGFKAYFDGTLIAQRNSANVTLPNINLDENYLGSHLGNVEFLNGSLDEVRIWNVERTCDQINYSKNCELVGNETGLVVYYNFNQGAAGGTNTGVTTITDLTSGSTPGILNNFALSGSTSNWVSDFAIPNNVACTGSSKEIDVYGNGVGIVSGDNTPDPADHTDFGDVDVNAGVFTRTFTIENPGSETLTISSATIGSGFTITTPPASTIPGGGNTTFEVSFDPSVSGIVSETLTINSDDCDEPIYTFQITGNGIQSGAAINFDGINDYITVPYHPSLTLNQGSFSIEFLAKSSSDGNWVVSKGSGNGDLDYIIGPVSGKWRFVARNLDIDISSTTNVSLGVYQHVACTFDGTTAKIYVNGVLEATDNTVGSPVANTSNLMIGGRVESGIPQQFFNGDIDEIRIWNRVLCDAEISAYQTCEIVGAPLGLVASYHFNQAVAGANNVVTSLTDGTGNGNNGNLSPGFALSGSTSNWVAPGGVAFGNTCSPANIPSLLVKNLIETLDINNGDITPTVADGTDFGSVNVPSGQVSNVFTVKNNGSVNLNITSVTSSNPDFVVSISPPPTILANGNSTFTVQFDPSVSGASTATITILSDDCINPIYTFEITGTGTVPAAIYYVDAAKSDNTGDGLSWATAKKDIQDAVNLSNSGDQIWVKAGTYKPTKTYYGNDSVYTQALTILLKDGIKLFGGFNGTETLLSQRNINANLTIISGDINGDDIITGSGPTLNISNNTENAYRPITYFGSASSTIGVVLSGFHLVRARSVLNIPSLVYVKDGYTIYTESSYNFIQGSSIFEYNKVYHNTTFGGCIAFDSRNNNPALSGDTIAFNSFYDNVMTYDGGCALFVASEGGNIHDNQVYSNSGNGFSVFVNPSNAKVYKNNINNNSNAYGAICLESYYSNFPTSNNLVFSNIIYNNQSSGVLMRGTKVKFFKNHISLNNNTSTLYTKGAGIYIINNNAMNSGLYDYHIFHNIIRDNNSVDGGGIYVHMAYPKIYNNIIHQNNATNMGGGIYIIQNTHTYKSISLYNNVFHENAVGGNINTAGSDYKRDAGVHYVAGNSFQLTSSNYSGMFSPDSNRYITTPLFQNEGDSDGPDNILFTSDDGYFPAPTSPLRDSGVVVSARVFDVLGNSIDLMPDIGLYELPCTVPVSPTATSPIFVSSSGNTASLTATASTQIKWYDAPTGGNLLFTGIPFITPPITGPITFYAEASGCAASTSRVAVNVNIGGAFLSMTSNNNLIVDGSSSYSTTNNTDFGSIGNFTSISKWFYIENTGNATFNCSPNFTISPLVGTSTFFSVKTPMVTTSFTPGKKDSVEIQFVPLLAGADSVNVSLGNSISAIGFNFNFSLKAIATPGTPNIEVRGNGQLIPPNGSNVPAISDNTEFGNVAVGGYKFVWFKVINSGTDSLSMVLPSISGSSNFTILSNLSTTKLAPFTSDSLLIRFDPLSLGTFNAQIYINSNDPDQATYSFNLQGTGVNLPFMEVKGDPFGIKSTILQGSFPSSIDSTDFGTTYVNQPIIVYYQISNSGSQNLTISSITKSGSNPSNFTILNPPSSPIAQNSIYLLKVQFLAATNNYYTATININSNDSQFPVFSFNVGASAQTCSTPFYITSNKNMIDVCLSGGLDSFNVTALYATSYQWYKDNIPLPTENSKQINFASVTSAEAGVYKLEMINFCGSTFSPEFKVYVNSTAPILDVNDNSNDTVCTGSAYQKVYALTNTASSYTWYRGVTNIGFDNDTLFINSVTAADTGSYYCTISNACGPTMSPFQQLSIYSYPSSVTQPKNTDICQNASDTLRMSNISGYTYQWFKNNTILAGETDTSLVLTSMNTALLGNYFCEYSANGCVYYSDTVSVTMNTNKPFLVKNVLPKYGVCSGGNVTMDFIPSTNTTDIQWYDLIAPKSGITTSSFTIQFASPAVQGSYYAILKNGCGSIYTDTTFLQWDSGPPTVSGNITAKDSVCKFSEDTIKGSASNAVTTIWKKNGLIYGTTYDSILVINKFLLFHQGKYTATYSNGCGNVDATDTVSVIVKDCDLVPNIYYSEVHKVFGDPDFKINISSNSPAPFKYSVDTIGLGYENGNSILSIDSITGKIQIKSAGIARIKATQVATGSYLSGTAYALVYILKKMPTVEFKNNQGFLNTDANAKLQSFVFDQNYDGVVWFKKISGNFADVDSAGNLTNLSEGTIRVKAIYESTTNFEYAEVEADVKIYINPLKPLAVNDEFILDTSVINRFNYFQLQISANDKGFTGYLDRNKIDLNPDQEGIQKVYINGQGKFEIDTFGVITYTILAPTLTKSVCTYTITDSRGDVSNVATITFDIRIEIPPPFVAPELLSPNGDQINDVFVIGYLEEDTGNEFFVYDYLGNLVYQKNNYSNDWDCKNMYTGQLIPDGVYAFIIKETNGTLRQLKGLVKIQK